jgi:hypothetical protein
VKLALAIVVALAAAPLFSGASGPARAETDASFILHAFPACKGAPVFSPFPDGTASSDDEADRRDAWFAKLKPIAGAPCVLPSKDGAGVIFCDKLVCRGITTDRIGP